MTCIKRLFSRRARSKVGWLMIGEALTFCRCFHAELVRHESRGLPIVHHSKYVCDLPPNHRFPMGKFPRVLRCLLKDQVITEKQVWVPEIASKDLLSCVHTEDYLHNFINGKLSEQEQRRTGFPWSEGIVRRCRYETGGTVLAAEVALQRGLACSTAGGTHHAFPSYGSGFCLLNDLAVAAKYVMDSSPTKCKVLIVDLDVHQGDGTAFIFKEEPSVFTFSVHCGKNFPLRKQQSDLDISVEDGLEDEDYLSAVQTHLPWLLETFHPDLVLYDAGVDPHWEDELGRLRLTDQDCGEQRCPRRCCYWWRILQRHRQTGCQTLYRPQSSSSGLEGVWRVKLIPLIERILGGLLIPERRCRCSSLGKLQKCNIIRPVRHLHLHIYLMYTVKIYYSR